MSLIRKAIVDALSKFTIGLTKDDLDLNLFEGTGELRNLELNTSFLEKSTGLPPYIKLEKIRVASIKLNFPQLTQIGQTRTTTVKLQGVEVTILLTNDVGNLSDFEEAEEVDLQLVDHAYGFLDRLIDSLDVQIEDVQVTLRDSLFMKLFQPKKILRKEVTLTKRAVGQRLGHLPSVNLKIENIRLCPTDKHYNAISDLSHWFEKIHGQKGFLMLRRFLSISGIEAFVSMDGDVNNTTNFSIPIEQITITGASKKSTRTSKPEFFRYRVMVDDIKTDLGPENLRVLSTFISGVMHLMKGWEPIMAALLAARAAKHEKKPPVVATGKKAAKESTQTELALARQLSDVEYMDETDEDIVVSSISIACNSVLLKLQDMYGKNEQGERALRDVAMFQLTGIDVHFSPTQPYNVKKSEWIKALHGDCMGEHVIQSSWEVSVDELRLLAIADCEHVFPEYADMLRRPGNATGPALQLSTVEYRSKDPLIRVDRSETRQPTLPVPCPALDVSVAQLEAIFTPVHLRNVVRILHRGLKPMPVPSSCKVPKILVAERRKSRHAAAAEDEIGLLDMRVTFPNLKALIPPMKSTEDGWTPTPSLLDIEVGEFTFSNRAFAPKGRISSRRITLRESLESTRPPETKKHTDISFPLGLLLITAHEAWLFTAKGQDMLAADINGKSDPYLIFKIDGKEVGRTDVRKATLEPKWQTQTYVDLASLEGKELYVSAWDWDQAKTDDFLGECTIPLSRLAIDAVGRGFQSGWHQLTNTPRGMIRLTLQWDPPTMKPNLCSEDVYGDAHTKIHPGPYGPFLLGEMFQGEPGSCAGRLHGSKDVPLQRIIDDCFEMGRTDGNGISCISLRDMGIIFKSNIEGEGRYMVKPLDLDVVIHDLEAGGVMESEDQLTNVATLMDISKPLDIHLWRECYTFLIEYSNLILHLITTYFDDLEEIARVETQATAGLRRLPAKMGGALPISLSCIAIESIHGSFMEDKQHVLLKGDIQHMQVAMEQTIRSIMCKLFADSAEIPGMPNASRVYMRLEPEDWGTLATSASTMRNISFSESHTELGLDLSERSVNRRSVTQKRQNLATPTMDAIPDSEANTPKLVTPSVLVTEVERQPFEADASKPSESQPETVAAGQSEAAASPMQPQPRDAHATFAETKAGTTAEGSEATASAPERSKGKKPEKRRTSVGKRVVSFVRRFSGGGDKDKNAS